MIDTSSFFYVDRYLNLRGGKVYSCERQYKKCKCAWSRFWDVV